jgi:hypothetical protein
MGCWNLDDSGNRSENTWKVLKCGAGEGWKKISWNDHVRNEV